MIKKNLRCLVCIYIQNVPMNNLEMLRCWLCWLRGTQQGFISNCKPYQTAITKGEKGLFWCNFCFLMSIHFTMSMTEEFSQNKAWPDIYLRAYRLFGLVTLNCSSGHWVTSLPFTEHSVSNVTYPLPLGFSSIFCLVILQSYPSSSFPSILFFNK